MVFLDIAGWLSEHLASCYFKKYLHIDCPGCGMQRSFIALLRGHFYESLTLYPALLPMLALFIFTPAHLVFRFRHGARIIMYGFMTVAGIIAVSYIIKHIIH